MNIVHFFIIIGALGIAGIIAAEIYFHNHEVE